MATRRFFVLFISVILLGSFHLFAYAAQEPENPKKRTTLGKYVTAHEAFEMWHAKPHEVKILDVRTPEEYVFVGHAPMARNIPLKAWTGKWNPEKKSFHLSENSDFVAQVKKYYAPTDTLLIMCRSGDRAAEAVNALAKAGFTNAHSIVDSFEGDPVTEEDSYHKGKRVKNGWKNSRAPWTYELDPNLIYQQDEPKSK
ncbi:rhodanese-like domain-containing protein [Desulfomonile tiedjei]|uniref:Rhodanese-related sulfurtransferase n=1 Tax=Desulfomonile tiedjei (strain ATCC 49306 / DSM 6799 / DCB-1) TaxID=706587 RepID=I4C4J5_DESTA|nr:rhodanese-like domain-containing protein [Desulfomonile tiedjei]AFM24486.1 Rhodanese-related sulfurtransferase [Desulfomonile tiedjei DSM 6799]